MSTSECIDPGSFIVEDGAIVPLPERQWRHVATAEVSGVGRSYPRSATPPDGLLLTVQVDWTNTTTLDQIVYALLTRGGARMVLGPRNRATIDTYLGFSAGTAPPDPTVDDMELFSRWGGGIDTGTGGIFGNDDYSIWEDRQPEHSALFGGVLLDTTPRVAVGEQVKARCELHFVTDNWTGNTVDGGNTEGVDTNLLSTGAARVDIYAYPAPE